MVWEKLLGWLRTIPSVMQVNRKHGKQELGTRPLLTVRCNTTMVWSDKLQETLTLGTTN